MLSVAVPSLVLSVVNAAAIVGTEKRLALA